MKTVFSSLVIAFSMYSKIPMPRVEWTEENRKYAICFFPLVGLVTGGLCYVWFLICGHLQAGTLLFSAGMAAIPLFLTGGIHVDGFMDTMDAMHSYLPREEKLRILKDSHIGAFSVICLLGYYLTYLGWISELRSERAVLCFCLGFLLSRILSGLSIVYLPGAKKEGLLYAFSSTAHKKTVRLVLFLLLGVCVLGMVLVSPLAGSLTVAGNLAVFGWYRYDSKKGIRRNHRGSGRLVSALCRVGECNGTGRHCFVVRRSFSLRPGVGSAPAVLFPAGSMGRLLPVSFSGAVPGPDRDSLQGPSKNASP